ncbi:enoyl-CoA hydratase/isomerase family protein [Nocardia sp. CA2R105]|uniref:enoyl-CoA hydratase/isomerase family protein n=1 Tax=Nocardia coffeae TaxID=2873381 RepID=UPI001CA6E234|nr:enoyl-CoA hydratase/isomerase family protein [Nocardia coffeae]MBY8857452.1 enoyl-CoA hydratase/isomerase family protein [Nocardia coffeae]
MSSETPRPELVVGTARPGFETIGLEVHEQDRVATITLNRPDRLNAFDRTMCTEMARAWQLLRTDDSVHAVVLRAAGTRAFSAGLDIKKSYGQPEGVWHHEDPGEALSPKWQKMWKPVVCAVQGMCTAGGFYFVNEADVVICSPEATFFDSHVSAGLVSALEPIGLRRRIGLGETLRIALMGNDERVGADTALRIGLVSEVVPVADLWARAHQIASTIAAKPPSATQGTVKAIWESLDKPYRAALDQGLIYTRLGNPLGTAELAAQGERDRNDRPEPRIR